MLFLCLDEISKRSSCENRFKIAQFDESEKSMEIHDHASKLELLCRVCGKHAGTTKAGVYAVELLKLYNIDASTDNNEIHPTRLCKACTSRLQRCRKSTNFKPMPVEVLTFRPHSNENCSVCMACQSIQPTSPDIKVGRPPKRKRGGFSGGQGTGQRQTVQQTLQREQDRSVEELPSTSSDVTIQRGSGGSEPTVESVRRKLLMIESVEESNDDDVRVSTEISSIPIERFVERDIAEHFVCCICQGVPTSPSMSSCDHIFCTGCIDQWLKNSSACPSCREVVESTDLDKLTGNTLNVYDSLRLQCVFHDLGCSTTCSLSDHKEHEKNCAFKGKGKRSTYGKKRVKQPLRTADKQYCKQKRLKPCYDFLNEFCEANVESKEDVLFFLLRSHLFDSSDRERAKLIDDIWSNMQSTMNVHECLTYRVDNLQTKNQYKAQYDKLKDKTIGVLLPPSQLDECEKRYMPGTTRYAIVGEDHHEHIYTTPVKFQRTGEAQTATSVEPLQIGNEFSLFSREVPGPNLTGVRFFYPDAVAKTLEEIESEIKSNLAELGVSSTDIVLRTFAKDGSDGMGDVAIYRGKGERALPGNAFRAAFAIIKCEAEINDKLVTVYEHKNPNSVRCNRPLIEAIAEENCKSSLIHCLLPTEAERETMKNKVMKIDCGDYWRNHFLVFMTSMVDEKLDRSAGGLQGAGSNYPCTLCDCKREDAIAKLGSFSINRNRREIAIIAETVRLNVPMHSLTNNVLNDMARGVKADPVLLSEPTERGLDATHANINLASFFKKVLVREVAQVTLWEKTSEVKSLLDMAERKLDDHLKATIGINPSLMLPGNYARAFFDEKNESALLSLIPDSSRQRVLFCCFVKVSICMKSV